MGALSQAFQRLRSSPVPTWAERVKRLHEQGIRLPRFFTKLDDGHLLIFFDSEDDYFEYYEMLPGLFDGCEVISDHGWLVLCSELAVQ